MTAFDKQREKRYYFTNELTPVRVYIKYDKEHESTQKRNYLNTLCSTPTIKDENKFESIKNKLRNISEKFQKEISNCKFIEETLSFVPIITKYQKKVKMIPIINPHLEAIVKK